MNIVLAAVLVMIVAIISIMFRTPKSIIVNAAPRMTQAPEIPAAAVKEQIRPVLAIRQVDAVKAVNPPADQAVEYTAGKGDTLSTVVTGLLGSDTRKNQDAVVAANPALQANPDRVVTGKTYVAVAGPEPVAAQQPAMEPRTVSVPTAKPQAAVPVAVATPTVAPVDASTDRVLKYTAQPGDSVSVLAAGLLGADSKTNRDAIIGENKSLQKDPDHVVSGKTYKIPTTSGLSAATVARPTTQPDADRLIQTGPNRELRYTARAGDSVSKLAEILLGSDTAANRDAIINNNVSLKSDPDRVMIGQVYWVPAPAAPVEKP